MVTASAEHNTAGACGIDDKPYDVPVPSEHNEPYPALAIVALGLDRELQRHVMNFLDAAADHLDWHRQDASGHRARRRGRHADNKRVRFYSTVALVNTLEQEKASG